MPTGVRLKEGHPTTISFAGAPNIALWEQTVTPPGADGGGPNDTTTMRNVAWRTRQPKVLVTLTAMSGVCQYDPAVYDDIVDQLNVNQLVTVTFSDGSQLRFQGWLDKFTPQEVREGAPPLANFTVEPSNEDANGTETGPTYVGPPS